MKKAYLIAIMLVLAILLSTCEAQTAETEPQTGLQEDEALLAKIEEFNNGILSQYILRLGDLEQSQIIRECVALVRENIINNKDAFFEKAKYTLNKKPAGEVDPNEWTPIDPNWQGLADTAVISMRKGFEGGASRATTYAMGLIRAWDPIQVAHTARMMVFSHIDKNKEFGKRIMLESIASPKLFVINNDPHDPVIGIETPVDLFIISLHHNYDGIYVPTEVKCFESKNLPAMKEAVEKKRKAEELKRKQEETRRERSAKAKAKRDLERRSKALAAKASEEKAKELEAEAKAMSAGQAKKAEEAKTE